jgi:hypothetical protein
VQQEGVGETLASCVVAAQVHVAWCVCTSHLDMQVSHNSMLFCTGELCLQCLTAVHLLLPLCTQQTHFSRTDSLSDQGSGQGAL